MLDNFLSTFIENKPMKITNNQGIRKVKSNFKIITITATFLFAFSSMAYIAFSSPNYEAKIAEQQDLQIEYHNSAERLRGELEVMEKRVVVLRNEISIQKSLHAVAQGKIEIHKENLNEGL